MFPTQMVHASHTLAIKTRKKGGWRVVDEGYDVWGGGKAMGMETFLSPSVRKSLVLLIAKSLTIKYITQKNVQQTPFFRVAWHMASRSE